MLVQQHYLYSVQSSSSSKCKPHNVQAAPVLFREHRRKRVVVEVVSNERQAASPLPPGHEKPLQNAQPTQPALQPCALFDFEHVPQWSPSLVAWVPFGAAVATGRVALWVMCIALDLPIFRNRSVIDAYLALIGVKITWHNLDMLPEGFHVMVSNHTNCGDLMALFTLPQRYIHLISPAIPAKAMATQHLPVMLRPAVLDTYDAIAESAQSPSSPPVHLFPEGGLTNGSGMMQFSRGFTKFAPPDTPVVPVALRTRTPWGLRTHTLCSSFALNLFLYSFCPQVHIEATVLPPMMQGKGDGVHPGEGRGAFVKRVQGAIAQHLGVPVTEVTIQQKRQMMKEHEKKGAKG